MGRQAEVKSAGGFLFLASRGHVLGFEPGFELLGGVRAELDRRAEAQLAVQTENALAQSRYSSCFSFPHTMR